ncbi:hypothetical protein MRX96_011224 [Rhipicephalus microplus]
MLDAFKSIPCWAPQQHPCSLFNNAEDNTLVHRRTLNAPRLDCLLISQVFWDTDLHLHCWDDLGYSFVIGGDGRVYLSRSLDRTSGHNQDSLAGGLHHRLLAPPTDSLRQRGHSRDCCSAALPWARSVATTRSMVTETPLAEHVPAMPCTPTFLGGGASTDLH